MKIIKSLPILITFTTILTSFSCQSPRNFEITPTEEIEEEIENTAVETVSEDEASEIVKMANEIPKLSFKEIWGYVMVGREHEFSPKYPITDVGYFCDAVNVYSELPYVPPRSKFFKNFKGRVHLTTSVDSRSQTHLLLSPALPLRDRIIEQMVKASETYDGLQIDWESVIKDDDENFWEFLRILKQKLNGKPLTMAIPARTRTLQKDAYCYEKLAEIADRIIIMAYDEHWSTSKPGAIASTDWCERIAKYTINQIPNEKIVMGLSFYGRTWMDAPVKAQAWVYKRIDQIKKDNNITEIQRDSYGIPHFTFKEEVTINGWYDDIPSLKIRCKMYKDLGIQNISFWRVGQENVDFWQWLEIEK